MLQALAVDIGIHVRCAVFQMVLLTIASQVCFGWKTRRLVRTACQPVTRREGQPQFVHERIKHFSQTSIFSFSTHRT